MRILPPLPLCIIPGTIAKSLIRENAWMIGMDTGGVVGMDNKISSDNVNLTSINLIITSGRW